MTESTSTTAPHWHAGSNVAGYLPEGDLAAERIESWADARGALREELEHEISALDYAPDDEDNAALHASLTSAMAEADAAVAGQPFSTYTTDGAPHRIPTAWWIQPCSETGCTSDDD